MASKAQIDLQPLVTIGPFKGLNSWQSPFHMDDAVLTDMSNMQMDESLGGVVTAKGRADLQTGFTDPLGLDVFYRATGTPYMVLVADGVWKLVDYVGAAAPVNITLPSTWDATAQTYFALAGTLVGKTVLLATNGLSTPLKIVDDFNPAAPAASKVGLATPLPEIVPSDSGVVGNPNGTYRYRFTFESATHESSPGPISDPITVTNKKITLVGIVASSDPTVIRRNIWRIGGSVPEWRLVGSINDNLTTTADDNVSDIDLGRLLSFDRDPIPLGLTVLISHKGRVFGFIGKDLYFSNFDEPEGWDATNVLPIGRGDPIITLGTTGSILLVFKVNQTWGLSGETLADFVPIKLYDVGCVGPRAACSAPGEVYWLGEDNIVWRSSGGTPDWQWSAPMYKTIRDLPSAAKKSCVMTYGSGKVIVGFPDASPVLTLLYDLKTQQWEKYPFGPKQVIALFSASQGDPGYFAFTEYTTAPTFNLRRFPGSVYGDLGVATAWFIERAQLTSGQPKLIKRYSELELDCPKQAGLSVTLTLTVEDDAAKTYTTTVSLASGPIRVGLPPEMIGTYLKIRISGSHSSKIEIQKIVVWGEIEHGYSRDKS